MNNPEEDKNDIYNKDYKNEDKESDGCEKHRLSIEDGE